MAHIYLTSSVRFQDSLATALKKKLQADAASEDTAEQISAGLDSKHAALLEASFEPSLYEIRV